MLICSHYVPIHFDQWLHNDYLEEYLIRIIRSQLNDNGIKNILSQSILNVIPQIKVWNKLLAFFFSVKLMYYVQNVNDCSKLNDTICFALQKHVYGKTATLSQNYSLFISLIQNYYVIPKTIDTKVLVKLRTASYLQRYHRTSLTTNCNLTVPFQWLNSVMPMMCFQTNSI